MRKIVFISGPGDIVGSYKHWVANENDPRVPVKTYAHMLFDLVQKLDMSLTVVHHHEACIEFEDNNVCFISAAKLNRMGINYYLNVLMWSIGLGRIVNRIKPDFLILDSFAPIHSFYFVKNQTQNILSLHNTFWPMGTNRPTDKKEKIKQFFLKHSLKKLYGAVCTSEECRRQLKSLVPDSPNLRVEIPFLAEQITARPISKGVSNIIYVGRMEVNKGIYLLLDVFCDLAKSYPELTLTFVGDGSALQKFRENLEEHPMAHKIAVKGRLAAKGVHQELAASDLLVCPTMTGFREGLALVGLEAACHGVPSILSSVVPAQDILGPSCRVFEADSFTDLMSTLKEVLETPERYQTMCNAALGISVSFKEEKDSWEDQLEQLIRQAL